jgi:hypothetical protein
MNSPPKVFLQRFSHDYRRCKIDTTAMMTAAKICPGKPGRSLRLADAAGQNGESGK